MTRFNHGIWIVFGSLVLFCLSYLGFHEVINCKNNSRVKCAQERVKCKINQLKRQTFQINQAIKIHQDENANLLRKSAELTKLVAEMQNQALSSEELMVFYNHLVKFSNDNNLHISSMDNETLHFNNSAIISLEMELEGQVSNLISWIKAVDTRDYPVLIHNYDISPSQKNGEKQHQLSVSLSILTQEE